MSTLVAQKQLAALIASALEQIIDQGMLNISDLPEINLEIPRDKSHGDFASNIALVLAKPAGKKPREIAEMIVENIDDQKFIDKVDIAGPGFINFFLSDQWLYNVLERIEAEKLDYGSSNFGAGEKVLLEFVSANPVGPMNIVNARAAAIGDTLARLFKASGYFVATEYYVNDAGVQTEIFGKSLLSRYRQINNPDYPFPDDGYPGDYIVDLAHELLNQNTALDWMTEDEQIEFCRTWGIDRMVDSQRQDLLDFNVKFDRWFRERELHQAKALENIIKILTERGYIYEAEGAKWFRSTAFGDDKDRVIIKNDGTYTYVTADIAYHYDKLKRGFTKLIDLLGPDHHGYIGRMKAAVQALGYSEDTLEILILQYVALLRDGQQVKMSKRAGEFITLKELLAEVGKDAARYFFIMRSLDSHLDFDLTLAAEQSSENPVYYIQYAHARICSIIRQAGAQSIAVKSVKDVSLQLLNHETEIDLMKKLAELPEEILLSTIERAPHRIARYALDLASLFHSFYTHCYIIGEKEELRDARLVLISCVRIVLERVLTLLGVSAPERM
ncbi:MAG: arginine--tRNA ligase [Firmicutes bacterium]|nr:arginine--tRNA ligase [Bacillota bacterium]